jgi:hypothetical protein
MYALTSSISHAENWVFVEALVFPEGCETWTACLDDTTDSRRNIMAMDDDITNSFLTALDAMAEIRNVPKPAETEPMEEPTTPRVINIMDVIPQLSILEVTKRPDVLRGLPGIYFDASRVVGDGNSDRFIAEFTQMLGTAGIPIFTEEEALLLPGAAKMSVSLSIMADNGGCILPFTASLSIKEELVLVRDPTIKIESATWSGRVAQNFANTNYGGYDALRDAAQKFIDDYLAANPS